ncbi:MAG: G-D-S-L family lipolytic protein, partial [Sphingobacterium sp.]
MKKHFNFYILLALLGFISACAPTLEEFEPSKGSADFSKFIAVGNSLTSGYADGGLYLAGQKVAFPNLIADQLKAIGGGDFNSPLFTQDQANGSGYIRLKSLVDGNPVTEAVTENLAIRGTVPGSDPAKPLYTKYLEPIQNLGVPGMRLDMSFLPGIGSVYGNPFFERLLADEASTSTKYVDYASDHEHTFFSLWLGNNDVLGYATNGAAPS